MIKSSSNEKSDKFRSFSVGSKPKYTLVHESEIQIYKICSHNSLLEKLIASRPWKKWETHQVTLGEKYLYSSQPRGYMQCNIYYNEIQEVVTGISNGVSFTIHLICPSFGSYIFQFSNAYARDQWFNSLVWKITICRFRNLHKKKGEDLKREIKELILYCQSTPLTDPVVIQLPLDTIARLLIDHGDEMNDDLREEILTSLIPLLEISLPTITTCVCFQQLWKKYRNLRMETFFLPSVERILKHNTDFSKSQHLRIFVQEYMSYLHGKHAEDESKDGISQFIDGIHTSNNTCPHQRVLSNLVSVSLACIFSIYEEQLQGDHETQLINSFTQVFKSIFKHKDWVLQLAVLLQAVPFPKQALEDERFYNMFSSIGLSFATDERCEVHQLLLPIRDEKDGWVHHFAPGGVCCKDDGAFFSKLMSLLVPCCYKRKKVLLAIKPYVRGLFALMAIRGEQYCNEVLIALLDHDIVEDSDEVKELISEIISSSEGRRQYGELCAKKIKYLEMKKAGGPRKLTLPSQSTDADLEHVLKNGSFGNLESLNLSFTRVTSASAKLIAGLPSLLQLNLWATPFDDDGLVEISEHCKLQSLNLCETPVTDHGLRSLIYLTSLKFLNVNSTGITALTHQYLKENLKLLYCNITYTDADV